MNSNQTLTTYNYPRISTRLIECLERDFPDRLPRKFQDTFELGLLVGQQMVIDKLRIEKSFNEKDVLNEID